MALSKKDLKYCANLMDQLSVAYASDSKSLHYIAELQLLLWKFEFALIYFKKEGKL